MGDLQQPPGCRSGPLLWVYLLQMGLGLINPKIPAICSHSVMLRSCECVSKWFYECWNRNKHYLKTLATVSVFWMNLPSTYFIESRAKVIILITFFFSSKKNAINLLFFKHSPLLKTFYLNFNYQIDTVELSVFVIFKITYILKSLCSVLAPASNTQLVFR